MFEVLPFEHEYAGEGQYFPDTMFFLAEKWADRASACSWLSLPKQLCYVGKGTAGLCQRKGSQGSRVHKIMLIWHGSNSSACIS